MNAEGLVPWDLQPPARLLVPHQHTRRNMRTRTVKLGGDVDGATVEILTWDACLSGCAAPVSSHEAGRSVLMKVPCDSLPHCGACECGSEHTLYVTNHQVADFLAALS